MNVNVVPDDVNKLKIIEKSFEPVERPVVVAHRSIIISHDKDEYILGVSLSVVGGIILFLVLFCLCKRRRKRRKLRKEQGHYSNSTIATTSVYTIPTQVQLTTEDVTRRYERSVSALSTKSQVYLVPFSALPPNFDFASREVEVKADYVILKDLRLLASYNNTMEASSHDEGIVNEAYQAQDSYNPYYYKNIPPLVQEPYKKQAAYNPTFY